MADPTWEIGFTELLDGPWNIASIQGKLFAATVGVNFHLTVRRQSCNSWSNDHSKDTKYIRQSF